MGEILAGLTRFTGNAQIDRNLSAVVLCLIILCVPLVVAMFMPLFDRHKHGGAKTLYLYAFTAGFFLVLGLFGEMNEGRSIALDAATADAPNNSWLSAGYQMAVLFGGGMIGLGCALSVKFFVAKRAARGRLDAPVDDHDAHVAFHNHPHAHEALLKSNAKRSEKAVAVYLVLSHRLAAGFFLGITLYGLSSPASSTDAHAHGATAGAAFLIGFFLHLIPEEAVIYFRLRAMGASRFKAAGTSAALLLLLVPFIFLGVNTGGYVDELWWLSGSIHVMVGVLLAFVAAVEFLPEAVRELKNLRRG